jgi:hypothetical protein
MSKTPLEEFEQIKQDLRYNLFEGLHDLSDEEGSAVMEELEERINMFNANYPQYMKKMNDFVDAISEEREQLLEEEMKQREELAELSFLEEIEKQRSNNQTRKSKKTLTTTRRPYTVYLPPNIPVKSKKNKHHSKKGGRRNRNTKKRQYDRIKKTK